MVVGCWLCGWESDSRDTDLKGRHHEQQRGQWGAAPPDPPCGTLICRGLPEVLQPLRQVPPDPSHAGWSRSHSFAPRTVRGKTGCKRQLGLGMMKGCWAFDRTVLLAAGHVVMRNKQTTTWCSAYSNSTPAQTPRQMSGYCSEEQQQTTTAVRHAANHH